MSVEQVVAERVGDAVARALPGPVARMTTLRPRTVARMLRLRRSVVYDLCRLGAFPTAYRKDAGRGDWLIPAADVAAYQAHQRAVTLSFEAGLSGETREPAGASGSRKSATPR